MRWYVPVLILLLSSCLLAEPTAGAIDTLRREAEVSHSDALLLWQDGKLLVEYYSPDGPKKVHAMSCTKSVVSMAIGKLLSEDRIERVDQAVADFYPEWRQGKKKLVTLRHLMSHTSGMQNVRETTMEEIYPSPDFVQLALAAELDHDPGTQFAYNNKAVNLLSGIVEKASGQRMDLYVQERLFDPLGIENVTWDLDEAGHAQGMAGLHIFPADFLKLGQLMLASGEWQGQVLLEPGWVLESTREQGETGCGLLWWVAYESQKYVVDEASVAEFKKRTESAELHQAAIAALGVYSDRETLRSAVRNAFEHCWELEENFRPFIDGHLIRVENVGRRGYYASGYLGQYLFVLPKERVVAVRMISGSEDYDKETDGFPNFVSKVLGCIDSSPL